MTKTEQPLVSVCMITYNHEPYIAQAIEGVLMQETDFPFELVIGEDCSTDGTRAICEDYARRFPETIVLLESRENLGIVPNLIRTIESCRGEYIAFCEGDDYWTDTKKIAVQTQFLEANLTYNGVFHNALVTSGGKLSAPNYLTQTSKTDFTFEDVAWRRVPIGTATLVVRSHVLRKNLENLLLYDWVIHLLTCENGVLKFVDREMSVYRKHDGGWTNKFTLEKSLEFARMTELCKDYFDDSHKAIFEYWLGHCYADVCFLSFAAEDYKSFNAYFKRCKQLWRHLSIRKKFALLYRAVLVKIGYATNVRQQRSN